MYEAEQKHLKKEKELEIARLRARQEKAKDYKAEQVRKKIPAELFSITMVSSAQMLYYKKPTLQ